MCDSELQEIKLSFRHELYFDIRIVMFTLAWQTDYCFRSLTERVALAKSQISLALSNTGLVNCWIYRKLIIASGRWPCL